MLIFLATLLATVSSIVRSRAALELENLALWTCPERFFDLKGLIKEFLESPSAVSDAAVGESVHLFFLRRDGRRKPT